MLRSRTAANALDIALAGLAGLAALAASACAPEAVPPATAPPASAPPAAAPSAQAPSASLASPPPVGSSAAATPIPIPPPTTPDAIAVTGTRVLLKAAAKGVQVYACKAKDGAPSTFEWALTGPDAQLFDDKGQPIGKHYAGPTWELGDGSKVIGKLHSKVDAPDPNAIPWLSIDAKETQGSGLLTRVKNIQRVGTTGGKAPKAGCDAAHAGAETRVDYTATYYFYGS